MALPFWAEQPCCPLFSPSVTADAPACITDGCGQVELFESAPEGAPVPGDELYQIALAHVVEGMRTFSVARIAAAEKMLTFLASQPRCLHVPSRPVKGSSCSYT